MTDGRPEPDQSDANAESGTSPAPIWARPAVPDPWTDDSASGGSAFKGYPQYAALQGFGSPHGPSADDDPTKPQPAPTDPASPDPPQGNPSQGSPDQGSPPPGSPPRGSPAPQNNPAQSDPLYSDPDFSYAPQAYGGPPGEQLPAGQPPGPGQYGTQPLPGGAWPPRPPDPGLIGGRGRGAVVALVAGVGLLAGVLGGVAGGALRDNVIDSTGRNPTISLPKPPAEDKNRPANAVTAVADAVLPSVVSIKVRAGAEAGTGSGFVIDADHGYILTNNHVVTAGGTAPATSIAVVFQDGSQVPGKVVGLDASYDLAVVKVQVKGLRELELGNSDAVRVGDPVVAIGAPLGLQGTVTTGIVSAKNRPVAAGEGNQPAFINAIQTDAAINPGNSGGPLVDSQGRVIAVNSAIARAPGGLGSSSGNIGLGFAIPSNQARRTAEQLIRTGKAQHPIIGVSLDNQYDGEGVKVSTRAARGVQPVTKGGPADHAGIRAGDVITKINGRPVTEPDELIVAIRAQTPGDTVTLTIRRGSSEKDVRVKLSASTD
jgi:putative serine protease PepD